jgi:hypothetical protein
VVLGDTSASLDAYDAQSLAVAVDGDTDPDDLAIEVEYDGVTQTAHVATGEVDAGVARALYDDDQDLTAGCTEVSDRCELSATDASSPLRPDSANLTASHVSLYPYDSALGWADEGTLWAGVRLQMFGANGVENAAGDYWSVTRQSAPVVTLDGAEPVRREGLKAGGLDSVGRVVFRVDAGAAPRELIVAQVLSLDGPGSAAELPVRARLDLAPVG